MAFYNQSVSAVREGRRRLEALNIPTKRPSDYFCENVKTDMHMNRVSPPSVSIIQPQKCSHTSYLYCVYSSSHRLRIGYCWKKRR